MIKLKKFLSPKSLAIFFSLASIFLSSCSSSLKSETNPTKISSQSKKIKYFPASIEEMNLYRQIGISYLCLARQAKVDFPKSISIASNNFALIVSNKHGGLIEEVGDKKLTNEQIYQGSYLQLIEGAIRVCPDEIPKEEQNKFLKAVEQLNNKN